MEPYEGEDTEARLAVFGEVAAEPAVTPNQPVLARILRQGSPRPCRW